MTSYTNPPSQLVSPHVPNNSVYRSSEPFADSTTSASVVNVPLSARGGQQQQQPPVSARGSTAMSPRPEYDAGPPSPCCVCLEALENDTTARILGCDHKIHMDCLTAMCSFQQANPSVQQTQHNHNSEVPGMRCPLCRNHFSQFYLPDGTVEEIETPQLSNTANTGLPGTILGSASVIRVATPTFTPFSSYVPWNSMVTITCATPRAAIYFSTDVLDLSSARQFRLHRYRQPIRIRGMRSCIRALAVKDGMMHSTLASMFCETTICSVRLSRCTMIIPAIITVAVAVLFISVLIRM
eukprot:PhF_6_TR3733/c0_g1_i2/m.5360